MRVTRWLAMAALFAPASQAIAQTPGKPQTPGKLPEEVAMTPIECWWKTDRSAIRVGEQFQLTLTCAVVDTEKVKVVVDESSLAPSALHLVPFEIVSGHRFRDILNSPRRFFQYQYTMRVLGEDFFGKEVALPRLQLSYRVQNALNGGSALSGREAQYSLRPVPIRVLSLVPPAAGDIRDTPPDTFGDVDVRLFRSNLLMIIAGVTLILALLLIVVAVVRATMKRRATVAKRVPRVSPAFVLWAASRELSSVKSASGREGWSSELAGRAAAALRLAGAVSLGRAVSQRSVDRGTDSSEGQIALWRGFRKKMMLSAAVTPGAGNGSTSALWDGLSQSLSTFTAVRYSRPPAGPGAPDSAGGPNGKLDGVALDNALAEAQDVVRRLRWRQLVRFTRPKRVAEVARQTWAR